MLWKTLKHDFENKFSGSQALKHVQHTFKHSFYTKKLQYMESRCHIHVTVIFTLTFLNMNQLNALKEDKNRYLIRYVRF